MLTLNDLQGHHTIKQSLGNALELNQAAHAYLFYGPVGVGKKTAAHAFAHGLLCRAVAGLNCGLCTDCQRLQSHSHPDLHVIVPEGQTIKINQLREMQNKAMMTSFSGGKQVFIVEQAEKMTKQAANCILKILEDPPPEVVFILVADAAQNILPTIWSRCQRYYFHALDQQLVYQIIQNQAPGTREQKQVAAKVAAGSPGQAMELLAGADTRRQALVLLTDILHSRPGQELYPRQEIKDRQDLANFIHWSVLLFRDALIWRTTGQQTLLINIDCQEMIQQLGRNYTKTQLIEILTVLQNAARQVVKNINQKLLLDHVVLKIKDLGSSA